MSQDLPSLPNLSAPRPEVDGSNSRLRSSLGVPKGWQDPQMPLSLSELPQLPDIRSPKLATQALTHRTMFTSTISEDPSLMHETIQQESYEPLEYLGDKYVATCVAVTLRRRYPRVPPAQTTGLVHDLVSNDTLSYISLAYRFHERIRIADSIPRENGFYNQKIYADLLEAHIGAMLEEAGGCDRDGRVLDWLFELFSPTIFPTLESTIETWTVKFEESLRVPKKKKRRAVDQLPALCSSCADLEPAQASVQYSQVYARQWHVRIVYDGAIEGCGTGSTKIEGHDTALANLVHNFKLNSSSSGKEEPEV